MADAGDSKSPARKGMRVRLPPPAPIQRSPAEPQPRFSSGFASAAIAVPLHYRPRRLEKARRKRATGGPATKEREEEVPPFAAMFKPLLDDLDAKDAADPDREPGVPEPNASTRGYVSPERCDERRLPFVNMGRQRDTCNIRCSSGCWSLSPPTPRP